MTEEEWLTCSSAWAMFRCLRSEASDRRIRLFACSCCRRAWEYIPDERSRRAVEITEQFADGLASDSDLGDARREANDAIGVVTLPTTDWTCAGDERHDPFYLGSYAAACVSSPFIHRNDAVPGGSRTVNQVGELICRLVAHAASLGVRDGNKTFNAHAEAEEQVQCRHIRDIFGNPFRPVSPEPAWLTSDVLALARGIYDERAFDRMPILGDALQDAGCDNEDILSHCRDTNQVHVRGCWVVDLVLGKQ